MILKFSNLARPVGQWTPQNLLSVSPGLGLQVHTYTGPVSASPALELQGHTFTQVLGIRTQVFTLAHKHIPD